MLKRRGNFPYDFDAAYPAYPTPVMPPNYVHNPVPPPATPPSVPVAAPPAPPPAADVAPPDIPQPIPSTTLTTQPPEIKSPPPKALPRKPIRRSAHFKPRPNKNSYPPPSESTAARHAGKCSICSHPDRHAIEDDFIHWVRPSSIAWEFDISPRVICRHARVSGLYDRRAKHYIEALELVLENAQSATVNGDMILRAIRAATHFRESGQWAEPPKHVIYSIEREPEPAIAQPPSDMAFASANNNPILELAPPLDPPPGQIDSPERIRNDASH